MATVIPLKSLITFLILAWVIISCPFRMPPRSSPMITSTIAISTKVKPVSVDVLRLKSDAFIWTPLLVERLEVLAQQVLIHSGFHISGNVRSRERGRICRALQLRADLAARRFAVVHLPVDGTRDFFRQIREADDRAGEAQAACADHSGLDADEAPGRVRRRRPAPGSRGQARDESGDAQMLPEQVGFRRGWRSAPGSAGVIGTVETRYDPVAVTARRRLGRPARGGVLVVAGNGAIAILVGGHGHDRDFHQGETGLGRNLAVGIKGTHATPETIPELKIRQKPARYVPDSMPVQPPFRAGDTALFVEKWTLTTTI